MPSARDELERILRDYAAMRIYLQETLDKIEKLYERPPVLVDYSRYGLEG